MQIMETIINRSSRIALNKAIVEIFTNAEQDCDRLDFFVVHIVSLVEDTEAVLWNL